MSSVLAQIFLSISQDSVLFPKAAPAAPAPDVIHHVRQAKLFLPIHPVCPGSGDTGCDYVINASDSCELKPATFKMVYFFFSHTT